MPVPTDIIQRVREAIVEALDTLAAVTVLTGRASGNVVPYKNREKAAKPVITYFVVVAKPIGGVGDTWRVTCQFSVIAEDDDDVTANALVNVISQRLTPPVLAGLLVVPLDAYVEDESRRSVGEDLSARADIDITFIVTN